MIKVTLHFPIDYILYNWLWRKKKTWTLILTSFDDLWPLEWPLPSPWHWLCDAAAIRIIRKPEASDMDPNNLIED